MATQDEYPAGVSDARLAACQQDVLKMVELAAQVAEGLAANVDPEAEGAPEANTIKEDAAMFLRLADGSGWVPLADEGGERVGLV